MQRVLLASFIGLAASACAYRPEPVMIVDSPADVRVCTRLGDVSPVVSTEGTGSPVYLGAGLRLGNTGFGYAIEEMREATVALGGTHLLMNRQAADWSLVRGIAYRCGPGVVREQTVIRAKG
jgi:hypothetical protein